MRARRAVMHVRRVRSSLSGVEGLGGHGGLSSLGGFVIRIRILMYPACILKETRILMYPDVSQTYLTCSVTFEGNTCILTFCMYCKRIPKESKIHLEYISDTSGYMYLVRFLGVTLDCHGAYCVCT